MKYLCMVFYDENIINNMTSSEWKSLNNECVACGEGLRESGKMIGGNALHPTATATSLRIHDG
ncbi:MAG: YciI family protein, partial [Pseudomonadota bacterium]|nr:YciI family protein [Pseudomonadota bacterium]